MTLRSVPTGDASFVRFGSVVLSPCGDRTSQSKKHGAWPDIARHHLRTATEAAHAAPGGIPSLCRYSSSQPTDHPGTRRMLRPTEQGGGRRT